MRRFTAAGRLLACALILCFLCSAARPFERLETDSPALAALQLAAGAGLLGDYSLPAEPLSRLEAAVLTSRALNAYGEALTAGSPASSETEEALANLSSEFSEELTQLGSGTQTAAAFQAYRDGRVSINAEEDAAADDAATADDGANEDSSAVAAAFAPADAAAEPAVDVKMYGFAQLQAQASSTKLTAGGSTSKSNADVYWGELGWDASYEDWRGHFSTLLNDENASADLYEAYLRHENADNGFFFQLGRAVQPFGNNSYYSPTFPAVNDLAFTTVNSIAVGVNRPDWDLSAWAFNPKVETTGQDDALNEYSVVWDVSKRDASECSPGWKLTAGYTSDLAAHDLRLAGDGPLANSVAAYNVFGRYDWDPDCESPKGQYHLIADYTAALDEYAPGDLDANGDGIGDKPSALNVELVHEPRTDNLFGVTYQATDQMVDYAETRWGLLYGERINKLVMLKLLASHGKYGSYVTGGQDSDNTFVAEFGLSF